MNLFQEYFNAFNKFRHHIAFHLGNKNHTYGEFLKLINGSRLLLEKQSAFKIQEPVGVLCNEFAETYAAVFAIWFSGGIFVPLNPSHPEKANEEILKRYNIKIVFCSEEYSNNKYSGDIKIINNQGIYSDASPHLFQWNDNQILYVLTTSGSTGTPKSVPINLKNVTAYIEGFLEMYPELNEKDRFLQTYDLTADAAFTCYLIPFILGATVCSVPRGQFKPFAVAKILKEEPVTFVKVTPSLLACLHPFFSSFHLPGIKHFHFGGEALPADMVEQWRLQIPNAEISNGYGPTETTVTSTIFKCLPYEKLKHKNNIVSIGKPFKNVEISIQKKTGNETGELYIGGDQVMENYWIAKEQPFTTLHVNGQSKKFYPTGDKVQQDNDSFLYFLGRLDDQVKINGYRVDLVEIENDVRKILSDVNNVVAAAVEKAPGMKQLIVFIENYTGDGNEILKEMKSHFPHFKVPEKIIGVEQFPLNSSGKTDKKSLITKFCLSTK